MFFNFSVVIGVVVPPFDDAFPQGGAHAQGTASRTSLGCQGSYDAVQGEGAPEIYGGDFRV